MNKIIGEIFETKEYDKFKRLEGNRSITAARSRKIRRSIEENGYILSPIAVNENNEVIDGQGRLEALELLNMPVHYYVIPGAGKEQCITLNIYGTPWSVVDYIKSYKEQGIDSYKFLDTLMEDRALPIGVIVYAVTGKENANEQIKKGTFECSREQFLQSDRVLEKCERVRSIVKSIPGNPDCVYRALIFTLSHCDVDEERLFMVLERNKGSIPRIGNMKEAFDMLSEIYNFKCRTNRVYLYQEYDKFQRSRFGWYANKWGDMKLFGDNREKLENEN